jgi:cardiolipin synthase
VERRVLHPNLFDPFGELLEALGPVLIEAERALALRRAARRGAPLPLGAFLLFDRMKRCLPCWVLVLALAACGSADKALVYLADSEVPSQGEGFSLALEQAVASTMEDGHRVELYENGEVFPQIQRAIAEARSSVHLLLFIWKPGAPSDDILQSLAKRAQGVDCRVLVDALGSVKFPEEVKPKLDAMGCEVRLFRTREGDRDLESRNHRKLVIVDGAIGITGGFGIDHMWLGNGLKEGEWRDQHVRIEGPAVREMQLAFTENWLEAGGKLLPAHAFPELSPVGPARATFVASSPEGGVTYGERMTQVLSAAAHERIWIANAYFIPPDGLLKRLAEKKREGVDVRVLVPGPLTDSRVVRFAQRGAYERMLKAGIRVFEYQPSMIHSKSMVVDDTLTIIGSNNLEPYSMEKLEEGSLVIEDAATNQELTRRFEEDFAHAKEIRLGAPELRLAGPKRALGKLLWLVGKR